MRMKQDKALLKYHGKSQVEHCYELLNTFCDRAFVSCRPNQWQNQNANDLTQIHDLETLTGIGPMGGILSAMEQHPKAAWLVIACDLPFLTESAILNLIENRDTSKVGTCYSSTSDGMPEPLCAIYEPSAKDALYKYYNLNK